MKFLRRESNALPTNIRTLSLKCTRPKLMLKQKPRKMRSRTCTASKKGVE
jgi:hypothetical protein